MRIDTLRLFQEVAESGSINKTAQNNFISQQGLSDAIRRMEKEMQVELFNRSKRGVTLTSEGEYIYKRVKNIVSEYNQIEQYLWEINLEKIKKEGQQGHIHLLVNPLAMPALVPDLLEVINLRYSHMELYCKDINTIDDMIWQVECGKADFCIFLVMQSEMESVLGKLPKTIKTYSLFTDEIVACVSNNSELAKAKSITSNELNSIEKVLSDGIYGISHTCGAEYISNNTDFQMKLLQTKEIAAITIRSFFEKTFSSDLVTALQVKPPLNICYLIMYSKDLKLDYCKLQFLQLLSDYVFDLTGQHVAYSRKLQIIKDGSCEN